MRDAKIVQLDIHHISVRLHLDLRPVHHPFHQFSTHSIDLDGSFTNAPKRTTGCFHPPTLPLASLTPTHIPPSPTLPHTQVIYRSPRRIIFHFYGRTR
ncbi:hypothetical protein AVEN_78840-1 [Araneus ventricosus]|uniref:Uncharacterized protein n=1 Tax=Araneus ventricosus TaxID=182803 RepID=A0A4Y1ZVT3_ARAVE|nr:hypothetical protein AVEN_78840-1 [Araneus ventricosus]